MMRRLGMPNNAPTSAAMPPASTSTIRKFSDSDTDRQVVGRVSADRHEGRGSERDLPAVADQDVEPDRGDRQNHERNDQRAKHVVARQRRHRQVGERDQRDHEPAVLRDRQQLLIGGVAGS